MKDIIKKLPTKYSSEILALGQARMHCIQEIRFRTGYGLCIKTADKIYSYPNNTIEKADIIRILEVLSNFSMHSIMDKLVNGYFTVGAGHRIGVCGEIICQGEAKTSLTNITSINIRIAKEYRGISDDFIDKLYEKNTLIISPPGFGKTTVLREIIRKLSDNNNFISVCDDRGEICSGFTVGANTDVLTGGDKKDNIIMLLRTMSPKYIALDEISSSEDTAAIKTIFNAGVYVLATAHSKTLDDAKNRYKEVIDNFDNIIAINIENNSHNYKFYHNRRE